MSQHLAVYITLGVSKMHPTVPILRLASQRGTVRHIDEVPAGLACQCTCVSCGETLVAKKGPLVTHHFAHVSGANCTGACETALHMAAKQALQRRLITSLPPVLVEYKTQRPALVVSEGQTIRFISVQLEAPQAELIVDALGICYNDRIAIEVRVTHPVDSRKIDRLKDLNLSALEIDLSTAPRDLTIQEIESLVVDERNNKHWLHHHSAEEARSQAIAASKLLPIILRRSSRHVDWCPLEHWHYKGKPYANVEFHCEVCPHALEISPEKGHVICDAKPSRSGNQNELFPNSDA